MALVLGHDLAHESAIDFARIIRKTRSRELHYICIAMTTYRSRKHQYVPSQSPRLQATLRHRYGPRSRSPYLEPTLKHVPAALLAGRRRQHRHTYDVMRASRRVAAINTVPRVGADYENPPAPACQARTAVEVCSNLYSLVSGLVFCRLLSAVLVTVVK